MLNVSTVSQMILSLITLPFVSGNNCSFAELDAELIEMLRNDPLLLAPVLANHVYFGVLPSVLVTDNETLTSAGGLPLTFSVREFTLGESIMVNDATIVNANILASNGIVHGIDTVLLPPETETNTTTMPTDVIDSPTLSPVDSTLPPDITIPDDTDSPTVSPGDTDSPTFAPVESESPTFSDAPFMQPTDSPVMQPTGTIVESTTPPSAAASVTCLLASIVSISLAVVMA